jgi:hypothetical protein
MRACHTMPAAVLCLRACYMQWPLGIPLASLHIFVWSPAGVSGKGVVELQAQLYRTQEHARLRAEGSVDVKDKHVRRKAGTVGTWCVAARTVEARRWVDS